MRRLALSIAAAIAFALPANAEGCDHGLSNLAQPFMQSAIKLRIAGKYEEAIEKLKSIPAGDGPSFCILYELGRNYLNLEEFDKSLESLQAASGIATDEDRSKQAIFNIIGYVRLKQQDYGNAVMTLERQQKDDQFASLPADKQTKVFNNTGFAYLRLSQYAPAKENFEKALVNGSTLAKANLAVVDSLIAVQSKGDADIPGVFSVSLHSQRGDIGLEESLDTFAKQLNVDPSEISIFRRETGMLSLVLGTNLSYAKAEMLQQKAIGSGFTSAQIVSTTSWENVSFNKKRAFTATTKN
jgi:tetratricopeptide (TPR) repeat protein